MVYYRRWEEFAAATSAVYDTSPQKTRYCIRWRHDVGLLVLKVTDDRTCVKFKTRSAVFLNRFELLNRSLLARIQQRKPSTLSPSPATHVVAEPRPETSTTPGAATTPAPVGAAREGGQEPKPAQKKKKSKKKK